MYFIDINYTYSNIAEVQLYLMILEQQEKYDKAIEVLEGPLNGKNFISIYVIQDYFSVLDFCCIVIIGLFFRKIISLSRHFAKKKS